jgi:2,4-dienoyl-CoA reductase-like NADH-dependent reductase (Old Yellow Enzyme family)
MLHGGAGGSLEAGHRGVSTCPPTYDAHDSWEDPHMPLGDFVHITCRVHAKGSAIFMQLWHMGRQSHSSYHGGKLPVAPSAIAVGQGQAHCADGQKRDFEVQQTRYNAVDQM